MPLPPLKLVQIAAKKAPTTDPGVDGKLWIDTVSIAGRRILVISSAPSLLASLTFSVPQNSQYIALFNEDF